MRYFTAAAVLAAFATPAFAQTSCRLENAIYAERENGYELHFRPGQPWEMRSTTESVFHLAMPDGRRLWGDISGNMGVSRDVGRLYWGCPSPTPDGPDLTDEEYENCLQWEGVVYSLNKGEPGMMPVEGDPAPERLLLTDLGRRIRYSDVVSSPGEEPWDVFDFKRCAK